MSLGIAINNEFLDLLPGTVLEMERENPFLQFGDQLKGSHSWPFDIRATDKNIRLTDYAALLQSRVDVKGQDAVLYDKNQHSIGKLKLERSNHNLNRVKDGMLSCYFLSEWAYFFQEIKDVKLREVDLGGDRSFIWDSFTRINDGFWGHIHKVIDAPAGYGNSDYDYTFYPAINTSFDEYSGDIMNRMEYTGGQVWFKALGTAGRTNPIVPFPYLSYIIKRVMAHIGWNITGDILEDEDFKKITLINFKSILWGACTTVLNMPLSNITFNLKQHVADINLVQFFLWLKNRFGWWYDIDKKTRTIQIKPLSVTALSNIKDVSRYANPIVPKKISQQKKGYALRNDFKGAFSDGTVDLANVAYQGTIDTKAILTATHPAGETQYGKVYLVVSENVYYICILNEAGAFSWEIFSPNIFDYVPEGENEDITSAATTISNERYDNYFDFIPRIDMAGDWDGSLGGPWGLHMAFYHGQLNNRSGAKIPFATSGIYDPAGVQVGAWSLCFVCFTYDGEDVGLYERNWKKFLATLGTREELEVTLNLPRVQYDELHFFDVISINNVHLYIKKIKDTIPYNGTVQLECLRI